jgi:hypothetical protein
VTKKLRSKTDTRAFAHIKAAKKCGFSAEETWKAIEEGICKSGMRPSARAMSLAIYQKYLLEVYGSDACAFFDDPVRALRNADTKGGAA